MKTYTVRCAGEELQVNEVTVSAVPFNRVWTGVQRAKEQTAPGFFVTVDADGPVTLEISVV